MSDNTLFAIIAGIIGVLFISLFIFVKSDFKHCLSQGYYTAHECQCATIDPKDWKEYKCNNNLF